LGSPLSCMSLRSKRTRKSYSSLSPSVTSGSRLALHSNGTLRALKTHLTSISNFALITNEPLDAPGTIFSILSILTWFSRFAWFSSWSNNARFARKAS